MPRQEKAEERTILNRPDYGDATPGDVAKSLLRPIGPRPNAPERNPEDQGDNSEQRRSPGIE